MSRKGTKILIVDDDTDILFSLSKVLEMEGYLPQTSPTGKEAIAKAKNEEFDVFLLDIKLPDMEGTEVLTELKKINPEAIKIMITGNPSIENAMKSLNIGANSFFTKPLGLEDLLSNLETKLAERDRQRNFDKRKMEEWVKLRISKIQLNEYSKFAELAADHFGVFGLNKSQAKIYTAVNALGVATASEIAELSKIRREEVYRIMPELENRGIIISKLDTPRKFTAAEPKVALKILVDIRLEAMEQEVKVINQKKQELLSLLESSSFGVHEEKSVEALSRQDNIEIRLNQMIKKAEKQILLVGTTENIQKIINSIAESCENHVELCAVVSVEDLEEQESEIEIRDTMERFMSSPYKINGGFDLRQVDKRSFHLVIVDNKEAIWGESNSEGTPSKVFWTNDPVQVDILKRAFDNLRQEALPCKH